MPCNPTLGLDGSTRPVKGISRAFKSKGEHGKSFGWGLCYFMGSSTGVCIIRPRENSRVLVIFCAELHYIARKNCILHISNL